PLKAKRWTNEMALPRGLEPLFSPREGAIHRWLSNNPPNGGNAASIIPCSSTPKLSNKIIQKGLAFVREKRGSGTVPSATRPRDSAPPAAQPRWGCGGGGERRRTNAMEDPDGKTHRYPTRHSVHGFAAR